MRQLRRIRGGAIWREWGLQGCRKVMIFQVYVSGAFYEYGRGNEYMACMRRIAARSLYEYS